MDSRRYQMSLFCFIKRISNNKGYSLFEMIATLSVLAVLIMGTLPLVQNAVKRQKEVKLRETLRHIRSAIDEFKRDTIGACPMGSVTTVNPTRQNANVPTDPRSRVVIDDCTIFDTENLDRYPPSLQMLVDGVTVRERGMNMTGGSGLNSGSPQATELNTTAELKKVYLRHMPIDPMTGESDWKFRSSYQSADDESWDEINLFDVRSASDGEGLDGTKYKDW